MIGRDGPRRGQLESQDDLAYITGRHGAEDRERQIVTASARSAQTWPREMPPERGPEVRKE